MEMIPSTHPSAPQLYWVTGRESPRARRRPPQTCRFWWEGFAPSWPVRVLRASAGPRAPCWELRSRKPTRPRLCESCGLRKTTSPRVPGAGRARGRGGGRSNTVSPAILSEKPQRRLFSRVLASVFAASASASSWLPPPPPPPPLQPHPSPGAKRFLILLLSPLQPLDTAIRAGPAGILSPHRPHTSIACPLSRTSNLSVRSARRRRRLRPPRPLSPRHGPPPDRRSEDPPTPLPTPSPEWGFVSAPGRWRLAPWRPPPRGRPAGPGPSARSPGRRPLTPRRPRRRPRGRGSASVGGRRRLWAGVGGAEWELRTQPSEPPRVRFLSWRSDCKITSLDAQIYMHARVSICVSCLSSLLFARHLSSETVGAFECFCC